jgi:hypothetical protein
MISQKNINKIGTALSNLLKRQNEDAFVIIEEPKSQKFVQFAGSANEPLIFDLPAQGLTEDELDQAKAVLGEYDIEMEGTEIYEDESMQKVVDTQYGFSAVLGEDLDLAVELAVRVLSEVYGLGEDANIALEEN